jgi:hypothetical protein
MKFGNIPARKVKIIKVKYKVLYDGGSGIFKVVAISKKFQGEATVEGHTVQEAKERIEKYIEARNVRNFKLVIEWEEVPPDTKW